MTGPATGHAVVDFATMTQRQVATADLHAPLVRNGVVCLDAIAKTLRRWWGIEAKVENTGGFTATLYAGVRRQVHNDPQYLSDVERWSALLGPGWFISQDGHLVGWAAEDELFLGRDEAEAPYQDMKGKTGREIVRAIVELVRVDIPGGNEK